MAVTCDCAEGRHEVCRGAGPNYYCPQTADMGDQVCACECHRRDELTEDATPIRPVDAAVREVWEPSKTGYTREQFEADRKARERAR